MSLRGRLAGEALPIKFGTTIIEVLINIAQSQGNKLRKTLHKKASDRHCDTGMRDATGHGSPVAKTDPVEGIRKNPLQRALDCRRDSSRSTTAGPSMP